MHCPRCQRFVQPGEITIRGENVLRVEARCERCGIVEPKDWVWEEIYGENDPS